MLFRIGRRKNIKKSEEVIEVETPQKLDEIDELKENLLSLVENFSENDLEAESSNVEVEKEVVLEELNIEDFLDVNLEEKASDIDIEEVEAKVEVKEPEVFEGKIEISEEEKARPIYILGENALACFLAIKLMEAGESVFVIASKNNLSSLKNTGVTLIENHSLRRSNHKLNTSFWLKETPKMLIITSETVKLNAALTSLSRKKLEDVPILMFTPLIDVKYIEKLLDRELYPAYFEGYLMQKDNQISLYGRGSKIVFVKSQNTKHNYLIESVFSSAKLNIVLEEEKKKAFWNYFSIYSACSLISAYYNRTVFDIIKDKEMREKAILVVLEICNIAKKDSFKIDSDEIVKIIYSTPLGYQYPLQSNIATGKSGDIDMISSNLTTIARKKKAKIEEVSVLLKRIYNIIMA